MRWSQRTKYKICRYKEYEAQVAQNPRDPGSYVIVIYYAMGGAMHIEQTRIEKEAMERAEWWLREYDMSGNKIGAE